MVFINSTFMRKSAFYILLIMIFFSCSNQQKIELPAYLEELDNLTVYSIDSKPKASIELVREIVFGDTDNIVLGLTIGLVVDEDERVFITDQQSNVVHVFDSHGKYVQSFGREGRGPGEFQNIWSIGIGDELIHIQCNIQSLIHVFSINSFELVHTTSLFFEDEQNSDLLGWTPNVAHVVNDQNYLVEFYQPIFEVSDEQRAQQLYRMTSQGELVSNLLQEFHWGGEYLTDLTIPTVVVVPYGRTTLLTVTEESFYSLWTEDLAVLKYDHDGNKLMSFYHPVQKKKLSRIDVMNEIEFSNDRQQQLFRNTTLPETWPAVKHFLIDDEKRFWISTITDDLSYFEWWVLTDNGEIIDRFFWPREKVIQFVKNDKIYVLETDQETGLDHVVRYKIILNT